VLYPALEFTMAAVLGLFAFTFGAPSSWFIIDFVILFAFVSLFFFDLKHRMLPDVILLPLVVIIGARLVMQRPDMLINACATGALLSGALGLLYVISHGRWLGLGDVKLAFVIGLLFGYPVAVGVTLVAIWAGALVGVGLILAKRANMQTALPFGSFWVAAAIITMMLPGPVSFISGLFTPLI
jgi:leader peptidase (prepilin peptidase)/N-methyltransferase